MVMELKIEQLLRKGVRIPNPQSIEIGEEVQIDRISGEGVVIHSGCRIFGLSTLVLAGARIGHQGPVTVENCWIGPQVELKGGYFNGSVFLKKSSIGIGAQIREGTILEEEASAAHTVGLKQTILFPFVTLGSLINFCDCLMSGGTSRKDHSEVGSSYIHFNYTPGQDKATPSLLGDVPKGVMLDQRPIFLGGQGGLVGPSRLAFGTVTAAGTICRIDEDRPDRLLFGESGKAGNIPYIAGLNRNIVRVVRNNLLYIANLISLLQWYGQVRRCLISDDFPEALFEGLTKTLRSALEERIKQLGRFVEITKDMDGAKSESPFGSQRQELTGRWAELDGFIRRQMEHEGNLALRDSFLNAIENSIASEGKDYIKVIKSMNTEQKVDGTRWLQSVVDVALSGSYRVLPSFMPP